MHSFDGDAFTWRRGGVLDGSESLPGVSAQTGNGSRAHRQHRRWRRDVFSHSP